MGHAVRQLVALLRRATSALPGLLALARRPVFLALGAYGVITIVFTWPVVPSLGLHIAGRPGDIRIALWDLWWLETAIREGHSPFHTRYLFYPEGVSLAYHSISWGFAAVALPLRALFGAIAGYNLAFLFQTFLCATTMFLLARYLVKEGLAAWLAGFIFAFEPFRWTRAMHHPNLAATAFIPLVLLWSLRAWRERRVRFAWLAGLALAVVLLCGAHLFIMTTFALALLFVIESLRESAFRDSSFWRTNAALLAACMVFAGPLVWGYASSNQELDEAIRSVTRYGATDLLSLFIVSPEQSLLGAVVEPGFRVRGESGSIAYLGYVALLLAVAALVLRPNRRKALPFALLFVVFIVLSLGSVLEVAGRRTGIVLPHAWLDDFRAVQAIRIPERFNLVARAFLAVVAAFGYASMRAWFGRRARLAWAFVPLLLLDYLSVPHPVLSMRQPRFVRELATRAGTGAILELPLTREDAKRAMLSQTTHHRPLVGGMVARTPRAAMRYIRQSRLLRSLEGSAPDRLDCTRVRLRRELEKLRRDGVEYVVYRHSVSTPSQRRAYEDILVGRPTYSDTNMRVFSIQGLLERSDLPCDTR